MAEESNVKPVPVRKRPDPFIFRLSHHLLKTISLVMAVVCLIAAAGFLGFTLYGLYLAAMGHNVLDPKLFAMEVVSTFLNGMFGRWFLQRSEYFKKPL